MNEELCNFLDSAECYNRKDPSIVTDSLAQLEVSPPRSFVEFYERYEGGFGSDYSGFMLLELVGTNELSVVGATLTCRRVHNFNLEHLAISDLCGEAILVYDCKRDAVFNVDFEGGSDMLKEAKLQPAWNSFEEFLNAYFLGH